MTLTAEQKAEVWELYWRTKIPVREIAEAYGIPFTNEVFLAAGPAWLAGVECRRCAGGVDVRSRDDGLRKRESFETLRKHPHCMAAWGYPDLCSKCREALQEEEAASFEQKRRAREMVRREQIARQRILRRMPYGEYLATPEWQATRRKALAAASHSCEVCSATERLHVHHRTYERRGQERPSDLTVLCADCHELFHKNRRLAAPAPSEAAA